MSRLGFASVLGLSVGFAAFASGAARADDPLMGKSPWNFQAQNRAALAIAIKQIEDPGSGAGGGGTTIVCGGNSGASGQGATGSASGATANSSCIVVNNSDGAIITNPQYSDGNQDADSSVTSQQNNLGSIDEVAKILGGNKQGL